MMTNAFRRAVWLVLIFLTPAVFLNAQVTWNAGTGNWFTSSNWTPGVVPTSAIDASINNGGTAQILTTGGQVKLLTLGANAGQSGTLQVQGGALTASSFMLVGDFGSGTVTVSSGGTLSTGITGIGNNAGSNGLVTVTGANSRWTFSSQGDVGSSGHGELHVLEGGTVSSGNGAMNVGNDNGASGLVVITGTTAATSSTVVFTFVGAAVNSTGEIRVTGPMATWNGGITSIGQNAQGTVTLSQGATGTTNTLNIGNTAVSVGSLTVQNANTTLTAASVNVGVSGRGTLLIADGGVVNGTLGRIGQNVGSTGEVTVTGANSRWLLSGDITTGSVSPGSGGSATLSILNGGRVRTNGRFNANANFNLTVSGTNSKLEILDVASFGSLAGVVVQNSQVQVVNGGSVVTGAPAALSNSTNFLAAVGDTLTVTITNGSWTAQGGMVITGVGTTTTTISQGSTINTSSTAPNVASFQMAGNAGGVHHLTVQGSGTVWNNSGWALIGDQGSATVTVENGAVMRSSFVDVARRATSTSKITVTGANSLWDASSLAGFASTIGEGGDGTLHILNGGEFRADTLTMGSSFLGVHGEGHLLVSGANSKLTLTGTAGIFDGELEVGLFNDSEAVFEKGGQLTGRYLSIAGNSGTTAEVTVSDAGSAIHLTEHIAVGVNGTGTFTVNSGATVVSKQGFVGDLDGAIGNATISGSGTSWTMTEDLEIGFQGTGTVIVENQATVTARQVRLNVSSEAPLPSVLEVRGGALLVTRQIREGGFSCGCGVGGGSEGVAGAKLNIDGGILRATANEQDFLFGFESGDVEFKSGGATIDSNGFNIGIGVPLGGAGGMTKTGQGILTLSGTTSYAGATLVSAGTLRVNGSITLSAVTLSDGATLGGTGSITGNTTINNGGRIAPGASPGTLSVGNLLLNNLSLLDYELGPPQPPGIAGTDSDLLQVNGALTLDGVLNIDPLTGFNIGTYRLINYSTLTNNFGLGLGDVPLGLNYTIDTATTGQVNLIVSLTDLQYWDGPNVLGNNVVDGGTGTWNNTSANWTTEVGIPNSAWNSKTAIFQGTAGTVTLGDDIDFEGLQFVTSGYVINQDLAQLYALHTATDAVVLVNAGAQATINAPITGSGGIAKGGTGTLVLTGAHSYLGDTAVNAGALYVNGSLVESSVTVASDATFGGIGRVEHGVTVGAGGIIRPGDATNPGALRVGSLSLGNTSVLAYSLGAPGNPNNSHIAVDGDLLLDGLLRITDAGGFTADAYNLMTYGGALTDALLTIQSMPAGFNPGNFAIDTDTAGEVNLVVVETGPGMQYWDGSHPGANGFIDGGDGIWNVTDTNWTNQAGNINGPWAGQTGVFTTRPGIVTLGSDIPFQKLIFQVSGYRIVSPAGQKLYSLGDAEMQVVGGARATIAAPISVTGTFTKSGPGRLILAGASPSYAGATLIQQGGLYVNTVLRSPLVRVGRAGTLGGSGIIVGNVLNHGTVASGNSVGALTIHGNFRQTGSGTLELEIASLHRFDQLSVSGTAHLGGTLDVRSLGADLEYGDQFPFLHAGRIKGRFSRITMPHPSVNRGRFFTVGGTGILLVAPTSYTLVAETPNQTRLARALDEWIGIEDGDIGVTTLALDMLREEQYPAAFEAILPGHYDAALQISAELAHSQMQGLHQQFSSRRLSIRSMGTEAYRKSAPRTPSTKNSKDVKAVQDQITPPEEDPWVVWTQATGLFSHTGWGTTPDREFDSGTFLAGADYALSDEFAVGIFAGYQMGESDYPGNNQADLEKVTFGAYALYDRGNFYAHAAVEGGAIEYEVRRAIVLPTLDRATHSEPDGHEVSASFGTGYDFQAGNFTFGPSLAIQYTRQSLSGFTERGADSLDLRLDDANVDSLRSYLGARVAYTMKLPGEVTVIPELRAFWQHEFLQDGETLHARLAGGSGPGFDYLTREPERDAFYLGGGVNVLMDQTFFGGLFYHAEFGRTDEANHTISVNANWRF
ncbi:autotransporter-associated beta strand protein/T5SS/PEP-CTERM-associated repeat protein [Roseimicrobium gellanilyticum]|uniref:Autotransporter-associated beta strand protein/T5SS/PEP-CTERM-associated repeat protein n=1 Tax=Roseimicrobium gellanilyticum TaxID=748857 RepID=A0A366H2C6_9BACT|nr:autotransporter domain-containing protein [Roseimicrobium gellanilyticum]RBP35926.1 autotransporter-associated beta strand protein/T5SS/PEP-CTERM-associated repeat protein [Roseimicrobium gellanilyticum]